MPSRAAAAKKPKKPNKAGKPAKLVKAGNAGKAAKAAPARRSMLPPPDAGVKALLDDIFGSHPELRTGSMFGCPGYFLGKRAVACVFGNDGSLTLPQPEIDELVNQPGYRRFQPGGRTMSGWILIDKPRLAALAKDRTLAEHAIEYARAKG